MRLCCGARFEAFSRYLAGTRREQQRLVSPIGPWMSEDLQREDLVYINRFH